MRYIDANALMQDVIAHSYPLTNAYSVGGVDDGMFTNGIQQVIDEQPTVDAVPVVHGHWEIVPNDENTDDYYKMRCSVCGEILWSIQSEELYCCKCGAKMDECADGERRTDETEGS